MAHRHTPPTVSAARSLRGITDYGLQAARLLLVGRDQPRLVELADQLIDDSVPRHFRFAPPVADKLRALPASSADFVLLETAGPLDAALLEEAARVAPQGFISVAPPRLT